MSVVRRAVAQQVPQMAANAVSFGDVDMYVAGGGLPEGDYAMTFDVVMYQAQKQTGQVSGPPRLGVMITAHSLTDPAADPRTQFLSMGSNADKSFAPDPDTGKGIVPIPNGVGATLNNQTNWFYFLKSLHDCGLPKGIFTNNVSVLDGVWVHTQSVPEPEERKGFQSKTAEVQEERQARTMAIVSEIKDNGKPWEGTGGIPAKGTAPLAAGKANGGAKTVLNRASVATKVVGKTVAQVKPATEITEEDLAVIAGNGITSVLEKNPNGCTHLMLRTQTFKAVGATDGDDMAQLVLDTFFTSPDTLNPILGVLGYSTDGKSVKAA